MRKVILLDVLGCWKTVVVLIVVQGIVPARRCCGWTEVIRVEVVHVVG